MQAVRISVVVTMLVAFAGSLGQSMAVAAPAPAKPPPPTLTKWLPLFEAAQLQARKERKIILAYFSGSDWEPFTLKLEKDVLNTDMFRNWATEHVILFQADYPREKKISANQKSQNERLKTRYSIIKVPTFILMDYSGLPFARATFDEAKLRDDEPKEQPKAWIKYLEETIKNRPPDEELIRQKNLTECLTYSKKHFISTVLLITKDHGEREMAAKDDLVHNQQFVKYMNRNVAYVEIEWPYDTDTSAEANAFRVFAAEQNIEPVPMQLVVWDMQTAKVNFRLKAVDPARAENIISLVEAHLPKIDYVGGWIEDYRQAQAIAHQQKRYIMLAFTSMDSSEFSKKMYLEIFRADDFRKFARKNLVTVDLDFPTTATQPTALAAQNKTLAEMYAIRGFPMVVVLNPLGQKIAEAKYNKGGPELFIKQLDAAIKIDADRRAFLDGAQ